MTDPENTLSRKRSQKEFEELLLRDVLVELEAGEADFWEQKAMELAGQPGYTPTPEQRAAFEERLDLEVKQIQKQKRQISQISHITQTTENHPISQDLQGFEELEETQESKTMQASQGQLVSQIPAKSSRKPRRILRKVGSIAAVLVLFIFMTMYHTVEAFAAGVDRFIATMVPADGAEELRIEEKQGEGIELDLAMFKGKYIPDWVPRGYVLSKVEAVMHLVKIEYTNKDGNIISYQISDAKHSWVVDDEEVVEKKIYVLDTWARVIEMDNLVCVVWEDEEYIYTVAGNVDLRDDLIKLVEKCVKVE